MTWRKWETEKRNRIKEQKRRWHYFFRYIAPPIVALFLAWAILLYMIDQIPSRRMVYVLIMPLCLYLSHLLIISYIWWQGQKDIRVQLVIAKGNFVPFFLFAFVLMCSFHSTRYEEIIINQFGTPATGRVVDLYTTSSKGRTGWHVTLQFAVGDRIYQVTRTTSRNMFYRLEREESMAIRYWPDNPQRTAWDDISQTRVNLGTIVTTQFILLALMGLAIRQVKQTQRELSS